MRQKTSLSLMELAVMVAVFALAAAVCLRAFVWADTHSRRSEAESWAATLCQSTADAIKAAEGDAEARLRAVAEAMEIPYGAFTAESACDFDGHYDADFRICTDRSYSYCLVVRPVETDILGLGKAEVAVTDSTYTDTLFSLEVCWQEEINWEVTGNE